MPRTSMATVRRSANRADTAAMRVTKKKEVVFSDDDLMQAVANAKADTPTSSLFTEGVDYTWTPRVATVFKVRHTNWVTVD